MVLGCASGAAPDLSGPPGAPLAGLSPAEQERFAAGRAIFQREFTPEEGLGPLFNEKRCSSCHDLPTAGGNGVERVTKATRFEAGQCDLLRDEGGDNVQRHATPLLEAAGVAHEEVPKRATAVAQIVPPALYGLGLLEAIPDDEILALESGQRRRSDGVTGRAARTVDGRIGRFGRKAQFATIRDFIDEAIRTELGLTTPRHPAEETVNGRPLPAGTDPAADPEVDEATLAALESYVRLLAPPAREIAAGALRDTLARGERIFREIGCAACHVATMTAGAVAGATGDHRVIHAYTDLLLHDMGPELASICSETAGPGVWRTTPLMGLRFRQTYLHDGRALRIDGAIQLHGGEAARARRAWEALPPRRRDLVVRFVHSL